MRRSVNRYFAPVFALFLSVATLAAQVTITTPASVGTYSTGTQQIPLSATGGTGAYTWAITAGTLPPGLALRTDTPSWFNAASQQAGLIGVATTPGNYAFTVQVTSGVGVTDTKALTLKVTALNIRDPFNMPDGFNGVPYSYTLSAINAAAPLPSPWRPAAFCPPG